MKTISLILVLGVILLAAIPVRAYSEPIYTARDIEVLHRRAKQGDAESQYHLGYAYAHGKVVIKDEREAMRWYRKAAENGHAEAARQLHSFERSQQSSVGQPDDGAGTADASLPAEPQSAASIFKEVWQSVVVVYNGDVQGSGVVIKPNVVATNCHVVDYGGQIVVHKSVKRTDKKVTFHATLRYANEAQDFCLLNVKGLQGVPATVRRYNTIRIGEKVYALGAPSGYELSISEGIVSQLRANDDERFIQTDAAISPGSSGGGLFDGAGNLIGITTSKISDESVEGIGFAIPADLVLGH